MLHDVVLVEALSDHRLRVRFDDGVEGIIAVDQLLTFSGVFQRLRDATFFAQVKVHPELGTVCWPNGADLDSEVLYSRIAGKLIPGCVPAKR